MSEKIKIAPVRILPEDVANKIAAGEVVERPASVVKELVENALDANATRVIVRIVAAGRRKIEVVDDGHGMSEHDALLSIERHATSKVRKADDLDNIRSFGFRGEAIASIAAVSRFELVTRRAQDDAATRIRVDGGMLRDVSQVAAPVGTRISVNRLYFNTPVRAKFLKGITTELSHSIDAVQRHALAECADEGRQGVGFQFLHNEKMLLDVPQNASLRERVALIWGLTFLKDMVEVKGENNGLSINGLIGTPALTRSDRSHQSFFMNRRPIVNRSLQYGFEEGFRGLLTVGRRPVGVIMCSMHPRSVDVNIHPTKREIRFRDERAARHAIREIVRNALEAVAPRVETAVPIQGPAPTPLAGHAQAPVQEQALVMQAVPAQALEENGANAVQAPQSFVRNVPESAPQAMPSEQTEFVETVVSSQTGAVEPEPVYRPMGYIDSAPMQLFDTYLLVPEEDRLLIIDQHALHERLTYDSLRKELEERDYEAQQLAVPLLLEVPPSHAKLLESNVELFSRLGIEIEPFGGNTYQVTSICHAYEDSQVPDAVYKVLDELAQGDFFDEQHIQSKLLRLAVSACRGSVKAGDRLSEEERKGLLEGFRRMRPPYTCPHGRPIITELTIQQMEKSFRRRQ